MQIDRINYYIWRSDLNRYLLVLHIFMFVLKNSFKAMGEILQLTNKGFI